VVIDGYGLFGPVGALYNASMTKTIDNISTAIASGYHQVLYDGSVDGLGNAVKFNYNSSTPSVVSCSPGQSYIAPTAADPGQPYVAPSWY
jgi:hypothetical protein